MDVHHFPLTDLFAGFTDEGWTFQRTPFTRVCYVFNINMYAILDIDPFASHLISSLLEIKIYFWHYAKFILGSFQESSEGTLYRILFNFSGCWSLDVCLLPSPPQSCWQKQCLEMRYTIKLEILWAMLTKWYPPLPHVLYGKVLVLLWETPKSFE